MSTNLPVVTTINPRGEQSPAWRKEGLRFNAYGSYLKRRFGERVHRVSLDAGFTCPNVDGTVAIGGCIFCDNRSFSPSRRFPRSTIFGQLEEGIRRIKLRYDADRFIAYFQPATNTYAPVATLRPLFEEPLSHEKVVGLAIGTRPDCVENEVLDLLSSLATRTYLSVEYGLQSIHDRSLKWMNRGHTYGHFVDAVQRSRQRGFEICAHVILGLPDESRTDMLATATELANLQLDAVKIHNLYAVKNTPLAGEVASGKVRLMERDEYVETLVDFLELLPPECVIERVSGDAPPDFLIGPSWCADKAALRIAINTEFSRRDSRQGLRYRSRSSSTG